MVTLSVVSKRNVFETHFHLNSRVNPNTFCAQLLHRVATSSFKREDGVS
jgi:hypothetical protein